MQSSPTITVSTPHRHTQTLRICWHGTRNRYFEVAATSLLQHRTNPAFATQASLPPCLLSITLPDVSQHFTILNNRRITICTDPLIQAVLSRDDVELPARPGTRDDVSPHRPFAEGPTSVRTYSVEYVELAVHVIDCKYPPFSHNFLTVARKQRPFINQGNQCHCCVLPITDPMLSVPPTRGAANSSSRYHNDTHSLDGIGFSRFESDYSTSAPNVP